jgi:hypothetical protein
VKVRYSVEGRAEANKEVQWWRENRRDNPDKAYRELLDVIALIEKGPKVHKPYGRLAGELVWRRLTATTRLHVYTDDGRLRDLGRALPQQPPLNSPDTRCCPLGRAVEVR